MNDERRVDESASSAEAPGSRRAPFPRWKKVLLTVAAFLVVAGAGLQAVAHFRGEAEVSDQRNLGRERGAGGSSLVAERSFIDGERSPAGGSGTEVGASEGLGQYSPALMKGGLSFFVGFCIGYALRAFLKVSAVVAGLVLIAIFGLSQAGLVTVDWAAMEGHFDRLTSTLGDQVSDFQSFISGSLPVAGMATLGLVTGLKKN